MPALALEPEPVSECTGSAPDELKSMAGAHPATVAAVEQVLYHSLMVLLDIPMMLPIQRTP